MSEERGSDRGRDGNVTRLPPEVIGTAYANGVAWSVLEDLVAIGDRTAGTPGEAAAANRLEKGFTDAGLREIRTTTFEIDGWKRGSSALEIGDERHEGQHAVLALPGSPGRAVEAPLVNAGFGSREEIEAVDPDGAIVMVSAGSPPGGEWRHRIEKFSDAVDAGASGFIFQNTESGCLPQTGEIGFGTRPAPIPAVGVSAELGSRIERINPASIAIEVDCETAPATSRNVSGAIGPDTDEEVLVTAHIDAHDISEGANDNGVGAALLVELATLLRSADEYLETRVRFVGLGSEEIGLCGSRSYAERIDPAAVKCVVNVDVAGRSRTPAVRGNGFEAMLEGFREASNALDIEVEESGGLTPHGDDWPFAARGIPAVMVTAAGDHEQRGWDHTHADTLDKLDRRDIREIAIALAESILTLAAADHTIPHVEPEAIRERLGERYERELRLQGFWPF